MFFICVNIVLYYCLVLYHMGFDFFFRFEFDGILVVLCSEMGLI